MPMHGLVPEDIQERFLRPKAVAEAAQTSSWGESDSIWIPDEREGYLLARPLKSEPGKAELECTGGIVAIPAGEKGVERSNPMRNDRTEDMASMTELNEATVLHNLRRRYQSNLIYTYSGLFLVAVNPWKDLPIYSDAIMSLYRSGRDTATTNTLPPHIYATADAAYRAMLETRRNQSILITGESGAGKTENTKRVIQYLAGRSGGAEGLEARLLQANPIMEAFGNAQTVRNNNSSRFGKFIKIDFDQSGSIVGGNIERYLLEKSRVTCRSAKERNFHVFYQFLRGASAELKASLGIIGGVEDYVYTRGSNHTVDGVNDAAEFADTMEAMRVLGMEEEERNSYLKGIATILLLGNLQLSEDEKGQAQFTRPADVEHLCEQLGVDAMQFSTAILNPVIKAGTELVSQGRDVAQVSQSLEALARALYERLFSRLVQRINQALSRSTSDTTRNWIGVLDIAGFEIFERNGFEQLCVNYTNEKLQQFFNHHMFTREQEEYARERVDWTPVDFGLDLQPTIDLIERGSPIGVLACLDEDCVVPKATDKSFSDKLCALWRGKSDKFEATRFGDAFAIQHYAGRVQYSTEGWLEKNKDPLNDSVIRVLVRSSNPFTASLFAGETDEDTSSRGIVKRGQFRTVAQRHRESLTLLMQQLGSTEPHFVRCIVPNGQKRPGELEARLVLDQLRCNGVLEGIRICRMGFPNRVPYGDFARLYELLATAPLDPDRKMATRQLLQQLAIPTDAYRLGQTKVFFKAGQLGLLDQQRDARLAAVLATFQGACRGALARQAKSRLIRQQEARTLLQRNVKRIVGLRQWSWWRLYMRVKPLLNVTRAENRIEELEDEVERLAAEREAQATQLRAELDAERDKLLAMETAKREYERQLQHAELQVGEAAQQRADLLDRMHALEAELEQARSKAIAMEQTLSKEKTDNEQAIAHMKMENETTIAGLRKDLSEMRERLDAIDFERGRLERSESSLKARLSELDGQLDEGRALRATLESRLRQSEEARRQLAEDSVSPARIAELQAGLDAQLAVVKVHHKEDMERAAEELDAVRKRLQREILAVSGELEAERKQLAAARDAIRQYENGTDSLTSELEAERRAQETWRRDRERLELRIKELQRLNQEVTEREDAVQASLFAANDAARELRQRIGVLEDEAMGLERAKKQAEAKAERLAESLATSQVELEAALQRSTQLESRLGEANARAADDQDEAALLKERLRAAEHLAKLQQAQHDETVRHLEAACEDCKRLEAQIKDLQMRLMEQSSSDPSDASSLRLGPQTIAALHQLRLQIEAESEDRLALIRDARSKDRTIAALQATQASADQHRFALEEALSKTEIRQRKMQTRVEQLEAGMAEAEFGRRRAERLLEEEREESQRLLRDLDRLKARLAASHTTI